MNNEHCSNCLESREEVIRLYSCSKCGERVCFKCVIIDEIFHKLYCPLCVKRYSPQLKNVYFRVCNFK